MNLPPVERFESNLGAKIYRIACEAFPRFIAYVYLVVDAGPVTLIDAGSGYGDCGKQLFEGLDSLRAQFGETARLSDVRQILITHGHIDHFGGLAAVVKETNAPVGIHELDRRVLSSYEERVVVATKALRVYLQRAGVPVESQALLMEMYGFSKKHVHSVNVDFLLEDGADIDGMSVIHCPGHCPGQVCLGIGDVLISADHILQRITPHQAPESITAYTGLGHYLESLKKVRKAAGFDIALGGHEAPIRDVYRRIDEIERSHQRKLDRVIEATRDADAPATIHEVTLKLYPNVKNFDTLLAIEEVGAHVEYLYQRGLLSVENLDEVEREENPALRYRPT